MRLLLSSLCALALLGAACTTKHVKNNDAPASQPATVSEPAPAPAAAPLPDDPYLWLEEVEGEKALSWAKGQNARSLGILEADPRYAEFRDIAERILEDKERIPGVNLRSGHLYNFWQDDTHVRGILRRVPVEKFLKAGADDDVPWETVLDVDALAEAEKENWVFKGSQCLRPEYRRCIVALSRGGKDATVKREYDAVDKRFVEGGFELPEAKSRITWLDDDTLLVGTDFGEGSLTESGYPRTIRRWKRGTELASAPEIFAGETEDVSVWSWHSVRPEGTLTLLGRAITFWTGEYHRLDADGSLHKLPLPEDADLEGIFQGRILVQLRSAWQGAKAGSLVSVDAQGQNMDVVIEPDERSAVEGVTTSQDAVFVKLLSNVRGRVLRFTREGDTWKSVTLGMPDKGEISIATSDAYSKHLLLSYAGFLTPRRLYLVPDGSGEPQVLRSLKATFSADGLEVEQLEATSKDGTKIPYFVVRKSGPPPEGGHPTLLYGYGGFENAMLPYYPRVTGKVWLEKGGVFVLANIRGGGEFGPRWHQAALLENRQKAFDDFIAVAEDLSARKITTPQRLGIMGGSNGGLLVGATLTQRPELFNAVVCLVPLLDMLRYTKLLAGASWAAEYGDPDDPKMRKVIEAYSPYQNVAKDAKYPEAFFLTSTRDDRVHPGHARKMVARMLEQGHQVLYYENMEGGHGAASNLKQHARRLALQYVYLHRKLMD